MTCYRCDSDAVVDDETELCAQCTKQMAKWEKDVSVLMEPKLIRMLDNIDLWHEHRGRD